MFLGEAFPAGAPMRRDHVGLRAEHIADDHTVHSLEHGVRTVHVASWRDSSGVLIKNKRARDALRQAVLHTEPYARLTLAVVREACTNPLQRLYTLCVFLIYAVICLTLALHRSNHRQQLLATDMVALQRLFNRHSAVLTGAPPPAASPIHSLGEVTGTSRLLEDGTGSAEGGEHQQPTQRHELSAQKRILTLEPSFIPIVAYVHSRPQYFSQVLAALKNVTGVERTVLVVSHDVPNDAMYRLSESVDFMQVLCWH